MHGKLLTPPGSCAWEGSDLICKSRGAGLSTLNLVELLWVYSSAPGTWEMSPAAFPYVKEGSNEGNVQRKGWKQLPITALLQGCEFYWELLQAQLYLKPARTFGAGNMELGIYRNWVFKTFQRLPGPCLEEMAPQSSLEKVKSMGKAEVLLSHFPFFYLRRKGRWGRFKKTQKN